MNKDQFEGQWRELKGKIKEKWGKFTDDEISQFDGKYDQFLGKLQKKYGYDRARAEEEIRSWRTEKHDRSDRSERTERGEKTKIR